MPTDRYYILENKKPVAVSLEEWGEWIEKAEPRDWKRVCQHRLNGIWISTVFLGIDHSWDDGPPILFETMTFIEEPDCGGHDFYARRYATWDEAIMGHLEACVECFAPGWKEEQLEEYASYKADRDRVLEEDSVPVSEDDP